MQTLTRNASNISSYIFEDGDTVTLEANRITCEHFIIADLNSGNATLHAGVTPPGDWAGNKYFFDGAVWTLNPNWEEPPDPSPPGTWPPE